MQLAGLRSGIIPQAVTGDRVDGYVSRMDYYKILGIEHPEGFRRHPGGDRFIPMSLVEENMSINDTAAALRNVIMAHLPFSESAMDAADYAFGEILDNVIQHSAADVPGVTAAQYYPKSSRVEICVADCGVGIPASMAENPLYLGLTNQGLLEKALQPNEGQYIGRSEFGTNKVSGGVGLSIAAKMCATLGGSLWVVSYGASIGVSNSGARRVGDLYYPGTVVVMDIPVTGAEVLGSDIMDDVPSLPFGWSPSEGQYYSESDDGFLW